MRRRHVTGLAPGALLLGPWAALGGPGLPLAGLILAGAAFVLYPVAALLSPGFPACLVRRQRRADWRHRRPRGEQRAGRVPGWLHRVTLAADRNRCRVRFPHPCSPALEVDHVVPFAVGGLVTIRNLVTLCRYLNQVKSDYWVSPDGYVNYHPRPGYSDVTLAVRVLAAERRARRNPLRYLRAALALR